jgi:hypothetical protein
VFVGVAVFVGVILGVIVMVKVVVGVLVLVLVVVAVLVGVCVFVAVLVGVCVLVGVLVVVGVGVLVGQVGVPSQTVQSPSIVSIINNSYISIGTALTNVTQPTNPVVVR